MGFSSETTGHPGVNFSLNGVGAYAVTGSFAVNAIDVDYSGAPPTLLQLSIDFERRANVSSAAAYGTFNYHYTGGDTPRPETCWNA